MKTTGARRAATAGEGTTSMPGTAPASAEAASETSNAKTR